MKFVNLPLTGGLLNFGTARRVLGGAAVAPRRNIAITLGVTRSADTFLTFKNRLKTELFKTCYS